MKKSLSLLIAVLCIASFCFLGTQSVTNTKCIADDGPIVIIPPYKLPNPKTSPVVFIIVPNVKIKTV